MDTKLPEKIAVMAADHTDDNRAAFYHALAKSQLYFPSPPPAGGPGQYAVKEGDQFNLTVTRGPNGESMMVVYANPEALAAFHPGESYAGVDARVLLHLARTNEHGLIIQSVHDGKASWAGVPPDHIASILELTSPKDS